MFYNDTMTDVEFDCLFGNILELAIAENSFFNYSLTQFQITTNF
jgi:hypothetical protein